MADAAFDIVSNVIVPLGSALLGAIAGYYPASRLAKRASDEVLRRDAAARRDQDVRAARQVFVKLHIIANRLGSYLQQLTGMIEKADRDGNGHMALHERLSVFSGVDREPTIEFSAEELAIYIAAKRPDYVDDLLLLSRRYAATLIHLQTFGDMKVSLYELTTRLGATTRAETGVTTTRVPRTDPLANQIIVKSGDLEFFAREMVDLTTQYDLFARDIASRFAEVTDGCLGKGAVPGFEPKVVSEMG